MKTKIVKNVGGRPQVVTKLVTAKLKQAFKYGCNIVTACQYAGISEDTFARRMADDEDFAVKIIQAQNYPRLLAGETVILSIAQKKDVMSARWWLEKKHADEFGGSPQVVSQTLNVFSFNTEQKETFNTQFRAFLRREQYA